MIKEQRIELINEAKELGMKSITIDGVVYEIATAHKKVEAEVLTDDQVKELLVPASPFDDLSDEEVMYWSTPHFDLIQEQKELREKQLKEEVINGKETI